MSAAADGSDDEPTSASPMLTPSTQQRQAAAAAQHNSDNNSPSAPQQHQRRADLGTSARVTPTPLNVGVANMSHSTSKKRWKLFERANSQWWNPQFSSVLLESCYWKCSFPQLRDRFRCGLVYLIVTEIAWFVYHILAPVHQGGNRVTWHAGLLMLIVVTLAILGFTFSSHNYQRFYLPTSFLCMFLVCVVSLLAFSLPSVGDRPAVSPVGAFVTSIEVVLLLYTVIPLPLYVCVVVGLLYTVLFEVLSLNHKIDNDIIDLHGLKLIMHLSVHLLGVHIYILSQVRHRKTFLKIGQSLIARKELESETQFKDKMIESVMPRFVADQLLKENSEMRRGSSNPDTGKRISDTGGGNKLLSAPNTPLAGLGTSRGAQATFRPFTMNLMTNVSILFADICGFTRMSSNKTADELVSLLNDLFGRFDRVCEVLGCEKISTLGDCYYAVSGCPVPRPDHAKCCVELGQAMIKAIRQFDADRGQDVNMRVGIHTGKVMCGLVGTKLFKFDVFSNDVTFANEMESSGMAGRIHVSDATAAFLQEEYQLEPGDDYQGVKTHFVVARLKGSTPETSSIPADQGSVQKHGRTASFKRKLTKKLKALQPTTSLPARASTATEASLRQKLLNKKEEPQTTANVENNLGLAEEYVATGKRRSVSEQAICTALAAGTSPAHGQPASSRSSAFTDPGGGLGSGSVRRQQLHTSSQLMAPKNSREMVMNGTRTASASGSLNEAQSASALCYRPASHSSGIDAAQGGGSDVGSLAAGLDTMTQLHANASLTRFDTDHRDFDRKLVDVIQKSNLASTSYWIGRDALNPCTMTFRDKDIESEYRQHFSAQAPAAQQDPLGSQSGPGRALSPGGELGQIGSGTGGVGAASQSSSNQTSGAYRYSAVVIDVVVAAVTYILVAIVCLIGFGVKEVGPFLPICLALSTIVCAAAVCRVLAPVIFNRNFAPVCDSWMPRHIYGLVLILLPGLLSFCALFYAPDEPADLVNVVRYHFLCAYIVLVCAFGHVNFSQLACWPKTLQAAVLSVLLVVFSQFCVASVGYCHVPTINNETLTPPSHNSNHSINKTHWPLFTGQSQYRWELVLDVSLALILIAFLNYQFEGAFRMAFYGGVQARRDTEQMQAMRDQADWLLSNIIPTHVVKELKINSKYSQNHDMVAVLFASIVNWNAMYAEDFEGGREFLRVLNEVIGDFDELLNLPEFSQVQKIKTIGPTLMAASGLVPERRRLAVHPYEHLYQLMEFAMALQQALANFNEDLLNFDFEMKIGYNIGPVTAGVIGTTKLYYDIWGDTVNVASRMYSTGVKGSVQVSADVKRMLEDRYDFEFREHIEVKGIDGGMDVYLLKGRKEGL